MGYDAKGRPGAIAQVRRWAMLATCLAAVTAAPAARATDLKVSGAWTAFVVKHSEGHNVCGVKTGYPDGRSFDILWFEGESVLTIQITKTGWLIPPHVQPKVSMSFPGSKPWEAQGLDLDHSTDMIELSVPNPVVKPFSHDIANAASGTVAFKGGSETPWQLDMTGFVVALRAMVNCIDDIAGATSTTTPYAYLHTPAPGPSAGLAAPNTGSRAASDVGPAREE